MFVTVTLTNSTATEFLRLFFFSSLTCVYWCTNSLCATNLKNTRHSHKGILTEEMLLSGSSTVIGTELW